MTTWLKQDSDGDAAVEALARAAYHYFSRLASGGDTGRMIP